MPTRILTSNPTNKTCQISAENLLTDFAWTSQLRSTWVLQQHGIRKYRVEHVYNDIG